MCTEKNANQNQTVRLVDAVQVSVVQHLELFVTFEDGISGKVTINESWLTGVFEQLKDKEAFNDVFIEHGAVTWQSGLDLAPDTMYQEIRKNGSYVLA